MAAWHEDARFYIFTDCDVFVDNNGRYLLAMNEAFDYHGNYTCCSYYRINNYNGTKWYDKGEHFGACNEYINKLEKAPWDVARTIISNYLSSWVSHEDGDMANDILDAKYCLMDYAIEDEKFTYC